MSSPSDTLRSARVARGFATAAEAARYFGWSEVTYTSHENGTRGLRKDTAERYSKAFGIDVTKLLGLHTSTLHVDADQGVNVEGTAAWGVWRDASMVSVRSDVIIEVPRTARSIARSAVLVSDQSVNRAVAEGSFVIYEPIEHHEVTTGRLLVLRRDRGGLIELSVRRIQSALDGKIRLVSWSTHHHFTEVLSIDLAERGDHEVLGIVVGVYTPM